MSQPSARSVLVLATARHLPPSAATLRLLDVGGRAGTTLADLRGDLDVLVLPDVPATWALDGDSVDAVVAVDPSDMSALLAHALPALRPGGRLIVVLAAGQPDPAHVETLKQAGYIRILVEAAGSGVLLRGEKAHTTDDTLARVAGVAGRDADAPDLSAFPGRYLYLLIRQQPNRPVWTLRAGEQVTWSAVALDTDAGTALLAFSALPRAVAFMQPAVLAGTIRDVNKVAKFSRETAGTWPQRVLVNPTPDVLGAWPVVMVEIDPATAEASDE